MARLIILIALLGGQTHAQSITVDGRLSPAQTLAGPNYAIGAGLGRQVGGNLFHSFGAFGLKGGETATFSGPAGVGHVIGRVTGGAASSIDGAIRSTIPGASLYLVNPAGVVFGPNASVDVGGSFHASSADYLRMKDGARFGAANPDASTLSAAPPEAFGFLSANPRPITVNGSTLQLLPGRTLGLVGGDVTISNGVLVTPGGTVHVASAAGPGEVPISPQTGPAPTVARSGRVQVANKASINADGASRGAGSGSIHVRAGELSIAASDIAAGNNGSGPPGVLSLHGDRTVALSNRTTVRAASSGAGGGPGISIGTAAGGTVTMDAATVSTTASGAGSGGAVAINTGALTLQNAASVLSRTTGRGDGGSIGVAANSVLLDGTGSGFTSETTGARPAGTGGSISLAGGTLTVQNNAAIEADTLGTGTGGVVSVAMTGDVLVANDGSIITNQFSRDGNTGPVTVSARNITLRDGAVIESDAPNGPQGNALTVAVAGDLVIESQQPDRQSDLPTGIISGSLLGGAGAGSGLVTAQNITLRGNSAIASSPFSPSRDGALTVTAQGNLTLDGRGSSSPAIFSGIAISFGDNFFLLGGPDTTTRSGNAEAINVNAANINLFSAVIGSTNDNSVGGVVGDLTITAKGAMTLSEGSSIQASTLNSSNAPTVRITAKELTLASSRVLGETLSTGRGAEISINVAGGVSIGGTGPNSPSLIASSSRGSGNAGNVTINAGTLTLAQGGAVAGVALASGSAGTITVNAGNVSVLSGGAITSSTAGTGRGGSVLVATPGMLLLDGRGVASTGITASATGPQSGSAGTVTVNAGTVAVQGRAQIASNTTGGGRGGDVGVTANSAVRLSGPGPQISATATGTGDAGSVAVAAPRVELRNGASISTAARLANGGDISIGPGDLLYLQQSAITTSVGGASGNGGNIAVEPRLVVLDRSAIQANAVGGNGGNVSVRAEQLVSSFDSAITASSQRGVSGEILVAAQPLNLNGSLVVLASDLRSAAALLREGCAVRGASPRSSLVAAGRGGQRQGLEATLPALYFAHRPIGDGEQPAPDVPAAPERISLGLSSPCG